MALNNKRLVNPLVKTPLQPFVQMFYLCEPSLALTLSSLFMFSTAADHRFLSSSSSRMRHGTRTRLYRSGASSNPNNHFDPAPHFDHPTDLDILYCSITFEHLFPLYLLDGVTSCLLKPDKFIDLASQPMGN